MKHGNSRDVLKWLKSTPTFKELCTEFPDEWISVQKIMSEAADKGNTRELDQLLKAQNKQNNTKRKAPKNGKNLDPELAHYIRGQMLQKAVRNHGLSEVTGVKKGRVKLNFLNGFTIQKLLFSHDLVRKPVSLFWFRLIWPLVWQKKYLMPLVEPKGIYCFYSRQLIDALAKLIDGKSCLEIAAGDGTLARFLKKEGVSVTATDNGSWQNATPDENTGEFNSGELEGVVALDAKKSLQKYNTEVVICSWPPANNDFEKEVFKTLSVQLYIVIASRVKSASCNWADYKQQTDFSFEEDKTLGKMLLPPELGCTVYIFKRLPSAD